MKLLPGCRTTEITATLMGVNCELNAQYEADGDAITLVDAEVISFGGTYLEGRAQIDIDLICERERANIEYAILDAHSERSEIEDDRYDCPIHGMQDSSDCVRC